MALENSLNGNYSRLYGEVVTQDIYRMREVANIVSVNDSSFIHEHGHARGFDFTPDVIFDLGANVGVFTRYARSLFPDALIVAVEPDKDNCRVFVHNTNDPKIVLINKAVGSGKIYRAKKAANGAMEVYASIGPGYNDEDLKHFQTSKVDALRITELKQYIKPGDKVVFKIDIEGSESSIFTDESSMEMLSTADYIAMELHHYAADGEKLKSVTSVIERAIERLSKTHRVEINTIFLYALKK